MFRVCSSFVYIGGFLSLGLINYSVYSVPYKQQKPVFPFQLFFFFFSLVSNEILVVSTGEGDNLSWLYLFAFKKWIPSDLVISSYGS